MDVVVAFKVVPDDQDIQITSDGSLDYSKAKKTVSAYDLNAIEAAVQLSDMVPDSRVIAVTVGGSDIDDSKLKKNVLARGIDELYMVADDAYADMDAHATAHALAALINKIENFDVILCGDGSADNYAQQTDIQLASLLDIPVVNAVTKVAAKDNAIEAERTLEDAIEAVEISLPAIVSVSPDIALPRIPGMKDILAAGKKPMNVSGAEVSVEKATEVVSCKAPKQADRKLEVLEATADGAIEQFAAALKAAL